MRNLGSNTAEAPPIYSNENRQNPVKLTSSLSWNCDKEFVAYLDMDDVKILAYFIFLHQKQHLWIENIQLPVFSDAFRIYSDYFVFAHTELNDHQEDQQWTWVQP